MGALRKRATFSLLIRTDNAALKSAVTNALMRYASMGEIETVKSNRILEQA